MQDNEIFPSVLKWEPYPESDQRYTQESSNLTGKILEKIGLPTHGHFL